MSAGVLPAAAVPARRRVLPPRLERRILWLFGFSGCIAFVEPSPFEIMFVVAALFFALQGLRLHPSGLLLAFLLLTLNIGGVLSLVPVIHDSRAVTFTATSIYMGFLGLLLATLVQERPVERIDAFRNGLAWAAAIGSVAGILGFFDVAGLAEMFTRNGRGSGTFKDPNVLGTFVILPIAFLVQDVLLKRGSWPRAVLLITLLALGGVFISFSRGAWGHTVLTCGLVVLLTFLVTRDAAVRFRITILSIVGAAVLAGGLVALLSIEEVRAMFEVRASLTQSYDVGNEGRFGKFEKALPDMLLWPNGYGPMQFRYYWPEDPHNVYVNAFASYGWTGGLSYLALVILTMVIGWRLVFRRTPWQNHAIAIWSTLFVECLQGIQIDTDHWRHWWVMIGLVWGLWGITATEAERSLPATKEEGSSA